jgi:uncharacterized protein YbjT (DUF2867 family)
MRDAGGAAGPPAEGEDGMLTLIAGASGYVGGQLAAALERRGSRVRCLARRPGRLQARLAPTTEVVEADCLRLETLRPALAGVATAYYLVHSLDAGARFAEVDRQAASNFGRAAREAGVKRIVYLGGLGTPGVSLSPHLRSRHETGDVLRASGVPVIELRASIVIGPGSLSFEMVRALVERLPVLVCPAWVRTPTQPIGIEDLVDYLLAAGGLPGASSHIYEIGGPDVVTYAEIMTAYARQRGLRRLLLPVPVLTPRLSGLWLNLVTPLQARAGRALVDGVRNATVVRFADARRDFPCIRPRPLGASLARALEIEDVEMRARRWSEPHSHAAAEYCGMRFAGRLVDSRAAVVDAPAADAFVPVRRIGGARGWYAGNLLWRLRGALDRLVGGAGLRRGRRDPEHLAPGDAVDCWRVERVEPDRLLLLAAEMKLPGRAWLQFEVTPLGPARSEVRQTAVFDPRGLLGRAYWYLLYPVHAAMFSGMLAAIMRMARPEQRFPAPRAAAPSAVVPASQDRRDHVRERSGRSLSQPVEDNRRRRREAASPLAG